MNRHGRFGVAVTLTVVFGLFSVPPLIFGGYLVFCWFRIHATDVYYVDYPYLLAAFIWMSIGTLCVVSTLYGAWRRSFYGLLFSIPVAFGLASMVAIPDAKPHTMRSMFADSNYLSSVNAFFRVWYEANRRFPANQSEFVDALTQGPAAWQYRVKAPSSDSPYCRRGTRLPYEIVVVTNAQGPRVNGLSERPGVIYYAVSGDQQQFWVTMTGLRDDVSHAASLKRVADISNEKVWVVGAAGKDYALRVH